MSTENQPRVNTDGSLGGRFWLGLIGALVLAAIALLLGVFAFGAAWSNWGFLAALGVFLGIACVGAYIVDRRDR
jgi:hypothetical protein